LLLFDVYLYFLFFIFHETLISEYYTLSLHDALPILLSKKSIGWTLIFLSSSKTFSNANSPLPVSQLPRDCLEVIPAAALAKVICCCFRNCRNFSPKI